MIVCVCSWLLFFFEHTREHIHNPDVEPTNTSSNVLSLPCYCSVGSLARGSDGPRPFVEDA